MSNYTRKLLVKGLALAASAALNVDSEAQAQEPPAVARAEGDGPRVDADRYLLLSDGRLIKGVISRDGAHYLVKQKPGVIRYSERQVERAFDSVREAYAYRLERVPEDDPAERLRLARWCMSWHLEAEARTLLEQVVEISPDHGPAKAMLTSVAHTEAARMARRDTKVDEGVKKTAGEEVVAEDRPGALDSAVLRGAERRMGITGLPVIFDLPPAVAVQRTEQFTRYVHPILQSDCVRCHNQAYDGTFQLVPVKSSRERTPDAIRANLDATLRLVDRDNPERSDLLTLVLLPHGIGGNRRPIYTGSNDRRYQVLSSWVTSLRPQPSAEMLAGPRTTDPDQAFAAGRDRKGPSKVDEMTRRTQLNHSRQMPGMRGQAVPGGDSSSFRYIPGQGMVAEDPAAGDPQEFPLPYAVGGVKPRPPGADPSVVDGRRQLGGPGDAIGPGAPVAAGPESGRLPDADPRDPTQPGAPGSRTGQNTGSTPGKKKPVKIDPKILEKFLQRNGGRPEAN